MKSKEQAQKFIDSHGIGTGTNITTSLLKSMMVEFANEYTESLKDNSQQRQEKLLSDEEIGKIYVLIKESLNRANLIYQKTDDDDNLPLLDALSVGDTIESGQKEIINLVEQIYFDIDEWLRDQPTRIDWDEILERLKTFCYTQHDDTPSIGGKCIDYLKSKLS